MDPSDFCVLDIETAGGTWERFPEGFDLLLTGVRRGDEYYAFSAEPASLAQTAAFLNGFQGVVVTFNGAFFDLPILDLSCRHALGQPVTVTHHYDLMAEIERSTGLRISLDRLSQYTFGEQKMPWDHRQNRRVWQEEPQRLIEYNRVDLDLTDELYRRVLRGELLFLGNATVVLTPPAQGGPAAQASAALQ